MKFSLDTKLPPWTVVGAKGGWKSLSGSYRRLLEVVGHLRVVGATIGQMGGQFRLMAAFGRASG